MHATFLTLWLQVVQPLTNVHETKLTSHINKRESDVEESSEFDFFYCCGLAVAFLVLHSSLIGEQLLH